MRVTKGVVPAVAVLLAATLDAGPTPQLADLMTAARPVGEVPRLENEYARLYYTVLEYPEAEPREAANRPVVLYVRIDVASRGVGARQCTRLLDPPRAARPSWRPGVVPRGVHIEMLEPPPAPSALGEPGTDPPGKAVVEETECGTRVVLATFEPFDPGVGTGPYPSVTTFLSDSVIDVWSRGTRRRLGVQAGDAFWFEGATRITVVDDVPAAVAIVQLVSR